MSDAISLVLFIYGLAIAVAMGAAVLIKLIVGALALSERRAETKATAAQAAAQPAAAPAATPAVGGDAIPPHHLVAIAAAAHAALGAHRILHIGAAASGRIWSTEGRLAQHTSHQPSHH